MRRFYTTLLEQDPNSEMARRWCAMTGLLPRNEAEKWVAEQTKKKLSGKSSPMKAAPKKKSSTAASAAKRKAPAPAEKKKSSTKATKTKNDNDGSRSDDEEDFKSARKAKASASKPKPKAVVAAAPPAAEKAPAKKTKKENDDENTTTTSSSGSDSDDGGAEVIPKPKQRGPNSVSQIWRTRDVAFHDGGLSGTDSDDDVPLAQRINNC